MGFDLYSLGNHKTDKGEYFRNNVWWWRRLADFVCEQTGVIAETDKEHWQSNSGHEVDEETAKQIAKQLKALIKDGTVSKAIIEVEKEMEKAEKNNKFVDRCHDMLRAKVEADTGKTNLAPALVIPTAGSNGPPGLRGSLSNFSNSKASSSSIVVVFGGL